MYIDPNNIDSLHLEFSSLCNAECPLCARNNNTALPKEITPFDQFKYWFPPETIKKIKRMYSCGNYGDPTSHPNCVEFMKWFIVNGCAFVSIHTNGGARSTDFWTELGSLGIRVVFSIDGLEDTNHIYRVGVSWDRLISNVAAFIAAGGQAIWSFLIFEHNQHQVGDAEMLASKLGFKQFKTKVSNRFLGTKSILNKHHQTIMPSKKSNKIYEDAIVRIKNDFSDLRSYEEKTVIECKTMADRSIYVDFEGRVWPCCWIGVHFDNNKDNHATTLYNKYGNDFNSLRHHSLTDILSNIWFTNGLIDSWTSADRINICGHTCGKILKPSSGTSSTKDITKQ